MVISGIHIRTSLSERLGNFIVVMGGGSHEWRPAILVGLVGISTVGEQEIRDSRATLGCGDDQNSCPLSALGIHVCAALYEQFGNRNMVAQDSIHERGHIQRVPAVNTGTGCEKLMHDAAVTSHSREHE